MSTEKQIHANRANAQRSSGPVSVEGKAAVAQNRTTHGLNYNPDTFRVLACEDQADYDSLLTALTEEHKPETITETLLVIRMAQHSWLVDRAERLQHTCLDEDTGAITDQKLFGLYLRYLTTHERAFHKCLSDILKLRAERQKLQIGFESEKRRQEHHELKMPRTIMEHTLLQLKYFHSLSAEDREKYLKGTLEVDLQAA